MRSNSIKTKGYRPNLGERPVFVLSELAPRRARAEAWAEPASRCPSSRPDPRAGKQLLQEVIKTCEAQSDCEEIYLHVQACRPASSPPSAYALVSVRVFPCRP